MNETQILAPMTALAFWTFAVLTLVPILRFRSVGRGETAADDYRLGESTGVPASVSLANRNYMNLLELPVLFYVVCLALYATATVDPLATALAWGYLGTRVAHSLVHLTYNHIMHRFLIFAASNLVLLALWVKFALTLDAGAAG